MVPSLSRTLSAQSFSFLKRRKLWRYVTGDIKAPTQGAAETPTEFIVRLEEWDNQHRLILFLMGLSDIYEPVRAFLLHRIPLLTLEQAISELLSEETRLGLVSTFHVDIALATPSSRGRGSSGGSRFSIWFCKHCRQRGPGHYRSDCPNNPTRRDTHPQSTTATAGVSSTAFASSILIDVSDLPTLVQQILSASGNPSIALSASTDISSWYFDFGCSNHMTSDLSIFSSKSYESSFPVIYTANGSSMTVDHVRHVSTSTLSLSHIYYVRNLALNLIFVGQLCDLGLTVPFSSTSCVVQDPRTGQTLGIGRRHGHVSLGRLRFLVSQGVLGPTVNEHLDYQSCQLAKQPTLSFTKSTSVSSEPFDLVHSDIWRPSPTSTMGGSQSSAQTMLKNTVIPPSLPLYEYKALFPTDLALRFWGEAALIAAYTNNRVSSPLHGNLTPYKCLYGTPPDYHSFMSLVMPTLFYYNHISGLNWSLGLVCVASWGMGLSIKAIVVGILCLVVFDCPLLPLLPTLLILPLSFFLRMFDVPTILPDDTLHVAPPTIVYPVESSSTDPAPPVPPLVHLPSDLLIRRSTRVKEVPSYLRDYHCFSIVLAQYEPHSYREAICSWHCSPYSLYVDDMIITGDDVHSISELQDFLHRHFEMKDLGPLSYFLGLEVSSGSTGYSLTQAKYASDLLTCAGLSDCKTASTPLKANARLTSLNGELLSDATLYRQLIGSLIYLIVTHLDIAHAVHLVRQFMSAPCSTHYAVVLRILWYVKGTLFHGLHFSNQSSLQLHAYSDVDWARDPTD
ncbi:hypothetical protein Acr_26g0001260 [Actinidia rufa]|uniref:Reverse transcriptase Ty1/copia-type domain-containing protein n=1 Tax=Actinidia rufa TaxID=165716 RepID=A0A7J0H198_9ERIC|nr:hypothetical protein Acr_26g0001260 [Actinidia rufa]